MSSTSFGDKVFYWPATYQVDLAKASAIHIYLVSISPVLGLCFYFLWFLGNKLILQLERKTRTLPIE